MRFVRKILGAHDADPRYQYDSEETRFDRETQRWQLKIDGQWITQPQSWPDSYCLAPTDAHGKSTSGI